MKIFVSVASYRDPQLIPTLLDAQSKMSGEHEVRFGIVCQEHPRHTPSFDSIQNYSLIHMHPKFAMGAGYARAEALKLYQGEDYFLQIDSHTRFEKNWDRLCISQLSDAKRVTMNNKTMLSYYPAPFIPESRGDYFPENSESYPTVPTRQVPVRKKQKFWGAERVFFSNLDRPHPEISKTVLAGFIFASAELIKEIPYDPEISFFGEELCFAVRAWTRGWDICSPSQNIAYHYYVREGHKKIWKDINIRKISWKELEEISAEKQRRILCGIEQGTFGAGNVRSLSDYEKFVGIDFKEIYGENK